MRRPLSSLLVCAALATVATAAPPASAQSAAAQAQGRALFDEGVALMGQHRYAEACPKLEASLDRFPGIGTRGKLAECYEKAGRLASAWRTYRDVARLAAEANEPAREKVAADRALAIEPRLSYLTVTPPSADVPGLVVKRNGKPVEQLGSAEPVDSGLVQVEATAPGRKPFTAQVMLVAGQTSKLDLPNLEPQTSATAASPRPAPAQPATPTAEPPVVTTESSSWQKPVGLVLGGAGLVAIGVGSVLGLSAKSKYDKAFDDGHCDRTTKSCDAAGQSDTDSARSSATTATILASAGGVALVGGVVLWLTAPKDRPTSALRVTPSVGPTYAGVAIGGAL